ncbi:MAG: hypothetical protein LBU58_07460 [Clostridiales bacterium]|jgi:hypothetical protein|nr:hypothetical protein [Clostridiales bacterium]
MKAQNKKGNQYEWLIIAEGISDVSVYKAYLKGSDPPVSCEVLGAGGKGKALNMNSWDEHIDTVANDIGRRGFRGIILVIDTDEGVVEPFAHYARSTDSRLTYISSSLAAATLDASSSFWLLDRLSGNETEVAVRGVNVPHKGVGCLESDLLASYGFPVQPQPEYDSLTGIIKKATDTWKIPNNDDDAPWWEPNEKAKMDKFIYAALKQGFKVSDKEPDMPPEPSVVANIRAAMLL